MSFWLIMLRGLKICCLPKEVRLKAFFYTVNDLIITMCLSQIHIPATDVKSLNQLCEIDLMVEKWTLSRLCTRRSSVSTFWNTSYLMFGLPTRTSAQIRSTYDKCCISCLEFNYLKWISYTIKSLTISCVHYMYAKISCPPPSSTSNLMVLFTTWIA